MSLLFPQRAPPISYHSRSSLILGKSLWTALYNGTSAVTPSNPKFLTSATKQASYTAQSYFNAISRSQDSLGALEVQRRPPEQIERSHSLCCGLESSVKLLPHSIRYLD